MLLVLGVACWLGYEVQQASSTRRQINTLRSLGGEVVLETSPWSLLRLFEPHAYGQRIVVIEVPADGLKEAMPILLSQSNLRALRIVCDGTLDVGPVRSELIELLPRTTIVPVTATIDHLGRQRGDTDYSRWPESKSRGRYQRFLVAVEQNKNLPPNVSEFLKVFAGDTPNTQSRPDYYTVFPCKDGSVGELLVISDQDALGTAAWNLALLLMDGRCVDALFLNELGYEPAFDDLRLDGRPELWFAYKGPGWNKPGGPRSARLYAIEPNGFRNLMRPGTNQLIEQP
jgi:hypothetical protein